MKQIFENNDFCLLLTGHDYDFVGIIETKTEEPLTFFFDEELIPGSDDENEDESEIDESKTKMLGVYKGLASYDYDTDDGTDETQEEAERLGATSWFRTRDDKSTGFLSDCRERGQFLAIVKQYCPEQLKEIAWA